MAEREFPIPQNESERLQQLSSLDIDYTSLNVSLKDLNRLAASVAGTEISLVNLIDAYTQWTVGSHGIELQQMGREESVCQYTIMGDQGFEVPDLSLDDRFNRNFYVVGDPLSLRYYFGLPLKDNGLNIGALCVMDSSYKTLTPEKVEMLRIIADEIVNRIRCYNILESMQHRLSNADQANKKVAHDIRGPLAGIIGLSEMLTQQGSSTSMGEVLDFIRMIHSGSKSLLDLADEILTQNEKEKNIGQHELTLTALRDKLLQLYLPQAVHKGIYLGITINEQTGNDIFSKQKVLQIIGNLISNAIKFTCRKGRILVNLDLVLGTETNLLDITVSDTGIGIEDYRLEELLSGTAASTDGTGEEKGYGFGLPLVKHLIEKLGGKLSVESSPGAGTTFRVQLVQKPV